MSLAYVAMSDAYSVWLFFRIVPISFYGRSRSERSSDKCNDSVLRRIFRSMSLRSVRSALDMCAWRLGDDTVSEPFGFTRTSPPWSWRPSHTRECPRSHALFAFKSQLAHIRSRSLRIKGMDRKIRLILAARTVSKGTIGGKKRYRPNCARWVYLKGNFRAMLTKEHAQAIIWRIKSSLHSKERAGVLARMYGLSIKTDYDFGLDEPGIEQRTIWTQSLPRIERLAKNRGR